MRDAITPLLLTYNEAPNVGRALERLRWAPRVVVLDSFSQDETEAVCRRFPNVEFIQRPFDNHTAQWNAGIAHAASPWVLALDADYILPASFADELETLSPGSDIDAYFASFRYCIGGRPLRASLYPPRAVLFRSAAAHYVADGHTQRLTFGGRAGHLQSVIDHDDRKSVSRWLWAQDRYAALEAAKLSVAPAASLPFIDRMRRLVVPAPLLIALFSLFGKGLIFEGWPGWFYAGQRTVAELILSLHLLEAKLTRRP